MPGRCKRVAQEIGRKNTNGIQNGSVQKKKKGKIVKKEKQKVQKKVTKKSVPLKRQSPIDISTKNCVVNKRTCKPSSLSITSCPSDISTLTVTPNGWRVDAAINGKATFSASHLPTSFKFIQFHSHWGKEGNCGSEHTINGHPYSGEIHFVFWNPIYKTFETAATKPDGLAVIAVLLEDKSDNPAYQIFCDAVTKALSTSTSVNLPKDFDFKSLIPVQSDYCTYLGSLTTSPFNESVIWTVLFEPIHLGKKQLDVFRRIVPSNYRKCQKICGRKISSNRKV